MALQGQLKRLRRNCTRIGDCTEQAEKMGPRFTDKGNHKEFIEERISDVAQMDRIALDKKNKQSDQHSDEVPIILDYNVQYKKIEKNHTTTLEFTADRLTPPIYITQQTQICLQKSSRDSRYSGKKCCGAP